jgi:DNA-binding NarL/FixJ family response regulator
MPPARPLTVAIVEDDGELRATFVALIEDSAEMSIAGAYASAEAALDPIATTHPDVVLMDIGLPGMSGIACVRRLKEAVADTQFVMLTAYDDSDLVFDSLQAGATGYLLKQSSAAQIREAVRDVMAGGAPMNAAIARKVVRHFAQHQPAAEVAVLSTRERLVLDALSQGQRYKEVADSQGISMNTVRTHIKEIYRKLHVNSRAEAVLKLGQR